MRRLSLKFIVGVFALGMVCAAPAAAAPNWPTGTIHCAIEGSVTFKPGLSSLPSAKAVKFKGAFTPAPAGCGFSGGVTGGKYPISAATAKISGSLPAGSTCSNFVNGLGFGKTKIQVTWQGLNTKGKLATVAKNSAVATGVVGGNPLLLESDPIAKNAFASKHLLVIGGFDAQNTFAGDCATPDGATSVSYGVVNPTYAATT